MPNDKNPQDLTPTFLRKLPDGSTEKLDGNGKPLNKTTSTTSQQSGAPQPQLKTGDLPKNTVGYGKLGAMQPPVTTYEGLRDVTEQQLKDAGLDDEQITALEAVKNASAKN